VREVGDQILFLHRLQPGGADRSYGIEVGRLAGLPGAVLAKARQMLVQLEGRGTGDGGREGRRQGVGERAEQLGLFSEWKHPAIEKLRGADVDNMTPLQALALVADLVKLAEDQGERRSS
jgi:DNA mismatch repair protein MutS